MFAGKLAVPKCWLFVAFNPLSALYVFNPLGAFGSQTAANDVESSSDDEESVYTFAEALQS
jgi:hypothetical protein